MGLRKLFALVPVTDELLADAATLSGYLARKTGISIRYKTNDALVNGDGAGQPLGIALHASEVSVAKEGSQAADTVQAENVAKMYARSTNPARSVWLMNHDVFPQLMLMSIANQPIWTPPAAGLAATPGGFLLGRPVILTQTCQTLGDKGDIRFVDWMSYVSISRTAGIETATSIHLWFDYDVTAFRATFRVDGQPWLNASVTPANGSNNLSPFVTLDERA